MVLGDRGLGDVLLALGLLQALSDATGHDAELRYEGPRPRLMRRCTLPLSTSLTDGPHIVRTGRNTGFEFHAVPERPPTWLDVLDDHHVEVHAALPMRYYLAAEQTLGTRLPADRAPLPAFRSVQHARPFHVVFVSATSWPDRKDYGTAGFARIATALTNGCAAPFTFTLITSNQPEPSPLADFEVLAGPDAVDCLDVFASADVVIGNDTGLTHLAALTERPDGTGPQVIGLYNRHSPAKWTTGNTRHHAVATAFSKMLDLADRCPVRDGLDDELWSRSARLNEIPAESIAGFANDLAGWW
ncbi:glycosyl transferase family 9 [Saccharopolyspora endophytica]|uniref:Glycosyl transferase family 9 n=1 Tax=Saccharopolyspora endophytica TaxID=543886 RepID=A0ABS5DQZ4_9PSEU|nr:glycosyl transferase family 9 [Saccharopolyspora endophytica]